MKNEEDIMAKVHVNMTKFNGGYRATIDVLPDIEEFADNINDLMDLVMSSVETTVTYYQQKGYDDAKDCVHDDSVYGDNKFIKDCYEYGAYLFDNELEGD